MGTNHWTRDAVTSVRALPKCHDYLIFPEICATDNLQSKRLNEKNYNFQGITIWLQSYINTYLSGRLYTDLYGSYSWNTIRSSYHTKYTYSYASSFIWIWPDAYQISAQAFVHFDSRFIITSKHIFPNTNTAQYNFKIGSSSCDAVLV